MTSLLRMVAVGALLCGLSTPAWAQGPLTNIINNGNHNINLVLNIQAPQINVGFPGMPGLPGPSCGHGVGHPGFGGGFGPGMPPVAPGFMPPSQNTIVNQGHGNVNRIINRGGFGPANNQIINIGNLNRNIIRNRGW